MKHTPLYDAHVSLGAKMVDFAGWAMPLHYGSQIEEHHQVRRDAGMFDVSHMTIIDLHGPRTRELLRHLLANNVDRLKQPGKAIYSCLLNEQGGIIDDLIVYFVEESWFRLVINAATRDKGLSWITRHAQPYNVQVLERPRLAMIAVQGPSARERVHQVLGERAAPAAGLDPFNAAICGELFIARTGYTGEDGYEIMLPGAQAAALWQQLLDAGVKPIGLGARDTLRLEAGMNLYGQDMDEGTTPLESGLGWTVAWEPASRDFIGRKALERQRHDKPQRKLVGLVLNDKGIMRPGQRVIVKGGEYGTITSGGFAPSLDRAIALARVSTTVGPTCKVEIRGKLLSATVVKPPFVRHGKPCLSELLKPVPHT